jgi:4-hydroxybenzoyl-CoA thioesterase/acyl-CoA thioester hydrolase
MVGVFFAPNNIHQNGRLLEDLHAMSRRFSWERRIEFRDTDAAGIAHFSTFFTMMEQAEHAWLRELGYSVLWKQADNTLSWPRVAAECSFESPLWFEEIVQLEGQITKLGRSSVTYRFRFRCGERRVAVGSITTVCCHVAHGEPPESVEIPAKIRSKLSEYVDTEQATT